MKKLVIMFSVLLVASSFAFEPKFSGVLVQSIGSALNSAIGMPNAATEGKSRFVLSGKVSDTTSITYITYANGFAQDYLWVDSMMMGGKMRFGTVRMGVANYGGGVYQTNLYCGIIEALGGFKTEGVGYISNMSGFDYQANFVGGYNANVAKRISLYAKTKLDTINLAVYGAFVMAASSVSDKSGMLFGVDADTKIAGFDIAGQAFTTLGDDAGSVIFNNAGAKTVAAGYVSYLLTDMNIKTYFDVVMSLTDTSKVCFNSAALLFNGETEMKLGATMPLSKEVNFNIEGKLNKAVNVDAVNTLQASVEFKI